MALHTQTFSTLTFHFTMLVLPPILYFCFTGLNLILIMMTICVFLMIYGPIVIYFSEKYKKLSHCFSFSYIKTHYYLQEKDVLYIKLFTILEELFASGTYKKMESYEVTYDFESYYKSFRIQFHDTIVQKPLHFGLYTSKITIGDAKNRTTFHITKHDQQVYAKYYNALMEHFVAIDTKRKEKEQLLFAQAHEKQRVKEEKIKMKDDAFFDHLLSKIVWMKKRGTAHVTVSKEEDVYDIQLNKRTIVVTKNQQNVWMKCSYVAGEAIVYVDNHSNQSTNYQKLMQFYTTFVS